MTFLRERRMASATTLRVYRLIAVENPGNNDWTFVEQSDILSPEDNNG